MSLITDKVFYNALAADSTLAAAVDDRIYNTSIPVPDDVLLNEPVPYIIITFDELQNDGFTKDNGWEGDTDTVKISIEVTAADRETLGTLIEAVRSAVQTYFTAAESTDDDWDLIPRSYQLTAGPVQYDAQKPCYFQALGYVCDTNP